MNLSKLVNPAPTVPRESTALRTHISPSLPACVTKPRPPSKNFLVDSLGLVHLTPPRRVITHKRREYLPPRAEYLFNSELPLYTRRERSLELDGTEAVEAPDSEIYVDMSVDPRAIRTEEEERRVQKYRAIVNAMARLSWLESEVPALSAPVMAEHANPSTVQPRLRPAVWPTAPHADEQGDWYHF